MVQSCYSCKSVSRVICCKIGRIVKYFNQCTTCSSSFSCHNNTWFKRYNPTLMLKWLLAVYRSKTNNSNEIMAHAGICSRTHTKYRRGYEQLTNHYGNFVMNKPLKLEGIVQLDETWIGSKRKHNVGRCSDSSGKWVFGMLSVTTGTFIAYIVPNRNSSTLINLILRHVTKNATIYSDGWRGYKDLTQYGYKHFTVLHNRHFVQRYVNVTTNKIRVVDTQKIERLWRDMKSYIMNRLRGISYTYSDIQGAIFEFMYRKNHKTGIYPCPEGNQLARFFADLAHITKKSKNIENFIHERPPLIEPKRQLISRNSRIATKITTSCQRGLGPIMYTNEGPVTPINARKRGPNAKYCHMVCPRGWVPVNRANKKCIVLRNRIAYQLKKKVKKSTRTIILNKKRISHCLGCQ